MIWNILSTSLGCCPDCLSSQLLVYAQPPQWWCGVKSWTVFDFDADDSDVSAVADQDLHFLILNVNPSNFLYQLQEEK